jgi:DNA polymerase-1
MLQECSWEGHILMTIHDEVVVEVPEKHSEEGLELVKRSMEEALNPFTGEPFLRVPIVADAKLVSKWAEAKN